MFLVLISISEKKNMLYRWIKALRETSIEAEAAGAVGAIQVL
jgi:hypothetical protein